jgi:hypothetical protein
LARVQAEKTVPTIACDWNAADWSVAAQREFVKIALGTAHFLLGESYSRSDAAGQLRRFLNTPDDELPSIPIHGQTWPLQVAPTLHFLYHGTTPDQHLVTLLHLDKRLTVFVSLFEEMRGVIQIADDPATCEEVKADDDFILTIDPNTRAFTQRTFEEFLKSLP